MFYARWRFPDLARWPSLAGWPSTLLARWPIVELASSINTPQWHLTKVHSHRIENKNKKLTKAGENYLNLFLTSAHRRSQPCGLDVRISARYDWSVVRRSTSFPLRHWNLRNLTLQTCLSITRDFFRLHSTFNRLYNAAASPPRVFARLARWQ